MTNTGKFKGKYRIPSARWAAWDYGSNAAYFVTICVANRAHDFGAITNGEMNLSPLGQSALDCWNEIPAHFPFVELGEFVVMPNHVHGIVAINKTHAVETHVVETQDLASLQTQNVARPVETQNSASLPRNRFGPQSQNLASIIRGYKIGVTKFARQNNLPFAWQARYHDHVIRNAAEQARIQQYILTNPQNWEKDSLYFQTPVKADSSGGNR
jgi:putative transposase